MTTASAWLLETPIFDRHVPDELVEALLKRSSHAALLHPGGQVPVARLADVSAERAHWPAGHSRPWVIVGSRQALPRFEAISWLRDGTAFDALAAQLLPHVDWAFMTYFTTYAATHCCLLSREAPPVGLLKQSQPLDQRLYTGPLPLTAHFCRASFYEPEDVGMAVLDLAQAFAQGPPLLLCAGGQAPLPTLCELEVLCYGQRQRYTLHQVTDPDAYAWLWAAAGQEDCVAEAVFAADTDRVALQDHLRRWGRCDVLRHGADFGAWAYGLVYGGGADEYHALFHARDPALTTWLWNQVAQPISRF